MEKKILKKLPNYVQANYKIITIVIVLVLSIFSFVSPVAAQTASLYFSPSTGSYVVGSTFAVNVYVSSTNQAINAVSGTVSFPQDNLTITSLSKPGSIINMWVQEPSFLNSVGTVNFEGIVPSPGFIGASGKIITINFKVKSAGVAIINFASGSVLANDGSGTNILKNSGSAQFNLSAASPIAPVVPVTPPPKNNSPIVSTPTVSLPPALQISSPTNPDPSKWYNNNNPELVWQLLPDILSIKTLYNKYPTSKPTIVHEPAISEIKIAANLKDGVYYFHLQPENSAGWGAVSHFRFQVDTQPPELFKINLIDGIETTNPQPIISFRTTDILSGIDHYKIKINNGDFFDIPPEQIINDSYVLPLQKSGPKSILIMALDKAGNYTVAYEEFVIKSINPPVITDYPQELENNAPLIIKGQSYPNSQIIIWLQGEKETARKWVTISDGEGHFVFTTDEKLKNGINKIWAQVVDKRGAKSDNSEKIIIIEHRSILFEIESWIINNIITAFLGAFLFCLLLTFWVVHMYGKRIILLKVPHRQKHS